jgi:hypothetical protein
MRSIFISYRRGDAEGQAGRLFDDLVAKFGKASVFMDVEDIEPGRDFRKVIDQHISSCGVLLSLVGKEWLNAADNEGHRRLDDPNDFVRFETATALKRDIPVIPVLVQGAGIPKADSLPDDLKDFAFRNAVELTHARWESDLQVLIKALGLYIEMDEQQDGSLTDKKEAVGLLKENKAEEKAKTQTGQDNHGLKWTIRWRPIFIALFTTIVLAVFGHTIYDKSRGTNEEQNTEFGRMTTNKAAKNTAETALKERLAAERLNPDNNKDQTKSAPSVVYNENEQYEKAIKTYKALKDAGLLDNAYYTARVIVPNVVGKQFEQAVMILKGAGFTVEEQFAQENIKSKPGMVLRQNPRAGSKSRPERAVKLLIASGKGAQTIH